MMNYAKPRKSSAVQSHRCRLGGRSRAPCQSESKHGDTGSARAGGVGVGDGSGMDDSRGKVMPHPIDRAGRSGRGAPAIREIKRRVIAKQGRRATGVQKHNALALFEMTFADQVNQARRALG